jgi:hypothetical protein
MKNNILQNFDIELNEYKKQLERHDWFFGYSDDPRVHRNGEYNYNFLIFVAQTKGLKYKVAFNEEHAKHFNNESFINYQKPFQV